MPAVADHSAPAVAPNSWVMVWALAQSGRERRFVAVAVLLTLLVHGGLVLAWLFVPRETELASPKPETVISLMPVAEVEVLPFFEANPEVAPEKPEDAAFISAQDQTAAQEDPVAEEAEPLPQVEDGELPDASKIIQGSAEVVESQPSPPGNPAAPGAPAQPTPAAETPPEPAQAAQVMAAVLEAPPVEDTEGIASVESRPAEQVALVQTPPEAQPETAPRPETPTAPPGEQVNRVQPQPRPRVPASLIVGPLQQTDRGAGRQGPAAIDSEFSEFGAYQQQMLEAISQQWQGMLKRSYRIGRGLGSVAVQFALDPQGEIVELRTVFSNAGEAAELLALESIRSRSPYGPWTRDMVQTLGQSATITITFHYR